MRDYWNVFGLIETNVLWNKKENKPSVFLSLTPWLKKIRIKWWEATTSDFYFYVNVLLFENGFVNSQTMISCILLYCLVGQFVAGANKELKILGLQPMTGEVWPGGWSCLVPVQMAIESINNRTDILNGYTITYNYIDHEVCTGSKHICFKRLWREKCF